MRRVLEKESLSLPYRFFPVPKDFNHKSILPLYNALNSPTNFFGHPLLDPGLYPGSQKTDGPQSTNASGFLKRYMAHLISLGLSLSSIKEEPINCKIDALGNKELEKYRLTVDPPKTNTQKHKQGYRCSSLGRVFAQSPGFDPSTVATVTHLKIPIL